MSVGDAHVFPGFFTPVLTQVVFSKPPTTIPTCFCRGERRKYAGKKVRLNWGSNSQPPCHESDTLTTVSHPAGATLSRNSSNTKVERSFNPSQTSPGFYVSAVHVFCKHCGKRRNCSLRAISPLPIWRSFCHFHHT